MEYLNFQIISAQIQAFQEFLSCLCLERTEPESEVFEWRGGGGGEDAEKVKHSQLHISAICTQPHFVKILQRVRIGHLYHGSKICESILWTEQHVGCGGR